MTSPPPRESKGLDRDPWTRRRPVKVSEWIARRIVHDIASQRLPPGTRLPSEAEAIERFQVSRGSLREALRILEDHGLVVMRPGPGGGPVVADISADDFARTATFYFHVLGVTLRDLLGARLLLDPVTARIAAESRAPEVIEPLRGFLERAEQRHDDWIDEAIRFHDALVGNTGNPILDLFARALQILYTDRLRTETYTESDRHPIDDAHISIAKAIIGGRGEDAEKLMRTHIQEMVEYAQQHHARLLDEVVDWR